MSFQALILVARVYLSVWSAAMKYRTRFGWELLDTARTNNAMVSLFAIYQQRQARLTGAGEVQLDLCELIRSTLNERSTDRRDRVYALYGLMGAHVAEELPVDYAEPVHQLSQRLSIYLLGHGNAAWTLIHSGGINDLRSSWSVDLNSLDGRHRMDYLSWTTSANGHNPAYAAVVIEPPAFQLDGSGRHLKVHGMFVERLSSIADAFHFPIGTMVGLEDGAKLTPKFTMSYVLWLDYVVDWAAQLPDSDPEAIWRTLVGNFDPFANALDWAASSRPLSEFGSYFDELIIWVRSIAKASPPIDVERLTPKELERYRLPPQGNRFWQAMVSPLLGRRLARVSSGALALIPVAAEATDVVAVFQGVPLPFLLRPAGDGYCVLGTCYVHGMMNGEVFDRGLQMTDILLE